MDFYTAATTASPAPTLMTTLLSGAIAGAALTALVSLFTGWLSRRHDQRRWLLDKRLEIYLSFNEGVNDYLNVEPDRGHELVKQMRDLLQHEDRMQLLAPSRTLAKTHRVVSALLEAIKSKPGQTEPGLNKVLVAEANAEQGDLLRLQRGDLQGINRWRRVNRKGAARQNPPS